MYSPAANSKNISLYVEVIKNGTLFG